MMTRTRVGGNKAEAGFSLSSASIMSYCVKCFNVFHDFVFKFSILCFFFNLSPDRVSIFHLKFDVTIFLLYLWSVHLRCFCFSA